MGLECLCQIKTEISWTSILFPSSHTAYNPFKLKAFCHASTSFHIQNVPVRTPESAHSIHTTAVPSHMYDRRVIAATRPNCSPPEVQFRGRDYESRQTSVGRERRADGLKSASVNPAGRTSLSINHQRCFIIRPAQIQTWTKLEGREQRRDIPASTCSSSRRVIDEQVFVVAS